MSHLDNRNGPPHKQLPISKRSEKGGTPLRKLIETNLVESKIVDINTTRSGNVQINYAVGDTNSSNNIMDG